MHICLVVAAAVFVVAKWLRESTITHCSMSIVSHPFANIASRGLDSPPINGCTIGRGTKTVWV